MPRKRKNPPPGRELDVRPSEVRRRRTSEQIINDLVDEGATLLQSLVDIDKERTEAIRELALVVLELRARHRDSDGRPDWAGRSQAYRESVAEMYAKAGLPTDSEASVQANLRYHIGNALRDRLEPAVLVDYGLKPSGPRVRQAERHHALNERAALGPSVITPAGAIDVGSRERERIPVRLPAGDPGGYDAGQERRDPSRDPLAVIGAAAEAVRVLRDGRTPTDPTDRTIVQRALENLQLNVTETLEVLRTHA